MMRDTVRVLGASRQPFFPDGARNDPRVRRCAAVLLIAGLLLPAFSPLARAQTNCFEDLSSKVGRGSEITLRARDGVTSTGRLQFVDLRENLLTVEETGPEGRFARSFKLGDISEIRYRSSNSHPGWMWGGMFVGILVTALIGDVLSSDPNDDSPTPGVIDNPDGGSLNIWPIVVGGVLGFAAGTVLSSTSKSEHTIECGVSVSAR
jgi:hypothetical protein